MKAISKPLDRLNNKRLNQLKAAEPLASSVAQLPKLSEKAEAPLMKKQESSKSLALLDKIGGNKAKVEKRIQELDMAASRKVKQPVQAVKIPSALDSDLNSLENVKNEKAVEMKAQPSKLIPDRLLNLEPLKRNEAKPEKGSPLNRLSALEALKGIEQLAEKSNRKKTAPVDLNIASKKIEAPALAPLTQLKKNEAGALDSVAEKLAKLEPLDSRKKIEISSPVKSKVVEPEFSSKLREVEISVSTTITPPERPSLSQSETAKPSNNGDGLGSSADIDKIQAMYIREVERKIMSKWKVPRLSSEEEEKEVQVSFYIYRKGNVDTLRIKKKSGNAKLDSLAMQAVENAERFPEFPKELVLSNMHLTINFKYKQDKT